MLKPILLVEDNPYDLELAMIALERTNLGNDIVVVRDGADAVSYLNCEDEHCNRPVGNPAVVILDLKLPKKDGHEVLAYIRETPSLSQIPVVMLTSSKEPQDLQKSYDLGVNAYVVKPLEFKQFLQTIGELGVFWAILNEGPPRSDRVQ